MTKEEALQKLKKEFYRTRVTKDIYVPVEVVNALLYGEEKDKRD